MTTSSVGAATCQGVQLHAITAHGAWAEAVLEYSRRTAGTSGCGAPTGRLVARITGPSSLLERHGRDLPDGLGGLEALALRLRGVGIPLDWGKPVTVERPRSLLAEFRDWGRTSVVAWRVQPDLITEMALGSWFALPFRARTVRRAFGVPLRSGTLASRGPKRQFRLRASLDSAFWAGARGEATADEWRRLTSGYVALMYHRLAGEFKPDQVHIDVPPERFSAQMKMLRRLGFTPLSVDDLLAFHTTGSPIPRRSFVVTVDDAFADVVVPLQATRGVHAQLFVSTQSVGGAAPWLSDELVAGWDELGLLQRAGVELGAHTRTHPRLPEIDDERARAEILGSRADLEERTGTRVRLFAYPYGAAGNRERELVAEAGFEIAWGVEPGRNGIGTDPLQLRRIIVLAWDSRLSVLVKTILGEHRYGLWERLLILRFRAVREHTLAWTWRQRR